MNEFQVNVNAIPMDAMFETSPTITELFLGGCPDELGMQMELLYVGYSAVVLPIDGTNDVKGDLEHVDDSDGDAVTNLAAAFDFEAGTARVMNTVYRGNLILDPGDTLNMEAAVTTPDTASEGAGLLVVTRIRKIMAD